MHHLYGAADMPSHDTSAHVNEYRVLKVLTASDLAGEAQLNID